VNDYERIELGFANLRDMGIYGQQDFACCGTCGWAEASERIKDSDEFIGLAFTSCRDYSDGYFGGQGTPMPPRVWLRIGHDDDLCDAWWEQHSERPRLNVSDLVGEMYISWYMPDDDPTPIVAALRDTGLKVSRRGDPNKAYSRHYKRPGTLERRREPSRRRRNRANGGADRN
jgi:hypothetical protein